MATVSFGLLDQGFNISDTSVTAYSSTEDEVSTIFGSVSTGGDEVEFRGSGLTYAASLPTGGTVTEVRVDLDNDDGGFREVRITGLSIAATAFNFNVGTAQEQNERIWSTILSGDDTINFDLQDFSVNLDFAGDGSDISDGLFIAGDDSFNDTGTALSNSSSFIFGDYDDINDGGVGVGGNDTFTVGIRYISGDFGNINSGGSGIGGDDVIAPARLVDTGTAIIILGDADPVFGTLFAGNDLIDLRATDLSGYTDTTRLWGDAFSVGTSGAVIGGNDTIHGSSQDDEIYGDVENVSGYLEGGKDRLFGYDGDDDIFGNSGRDVLGGGNGDDSLDGGDDGDIITADAGNDTLIGGSGNDSMTGGADDDTFIAGSGRDTLDGGSGDDLGDAAAGNDVILAGTGRDNFFGGNGADLMDGGGGNDTLSGGTGADTILGGNGFDVLLGGDNNDTLNGGGSNDILLGNAGSDTFVFAPGGGTDTIRDFSAGAGITDFINLSGFGAAFDSFAEVIAAAADDGTDTTINFGGGNVLILDDVLVGDLVADDFIF
ncbi:MAG: calcium-binding protein [Pseudomonadota bacterium]